MTPQGITYMKFTHKYKTNDPHPPMFSDFTNDSSNDPNDP